MLLTGIMAPRPPDGWVAARCQRGAGGGETVEGGDGATRVALAGGGTGGHIYPALAIADGLRGSRPGTSLVYLGTARGLEADLVPRAGIPFFPISGGGVVGKSPLAAARGMLALARGTVQAASILRRFSPHVVVGTGGYASVPAAAAAVLLRVPLVIQEQNVYPGVSNRLLARFAREVYVPAETTRRYLPCPERALVTGNPVRPELLAGRRDEAAARLGFDPRRPVLAVFGGSRGARAINRAAATALPALAGRGIQSLWVTGEAYHGEALAALRGAGIQPASSGNIRVEPYLHGMADALAVADLVVARAGAMTLAEVTARGVPAILVPSPNVAFDHQRHNARRLERAGAALVIAEQGLDGGRLAESAASLLGDPAALRSMAENSRRLGRPDALVAIVERILAVADAARRHRA